MNNALNHVSWGTFIETVAFLLVIYYLVIGLKFYRAELQTIFNRFAKKEQEPHRVPESLIYGEPEDLPALASQEEEVTYIAEADDLMEQTEAFIGRVKKIINQAATKSYAPATLIHSLQILFTEYPQIKNSPHRAAISELIASECEQTGTAQLSEDDVDAWWDVLSAVPEPGPGGNQALPDATGPAGR